MDFLYFLLLGALAGWLAGKLTKGSGFGFFANMIIGVIGAFIGGFLFSLLGLESNGGFIGSLVTALVGALVLLFIAGKAKK
jgi:uncharacterized membrane protein YeaQ/YmgE (transglycosylase-associated protein family)